MYLPSPSTRRLHHTLRWWKKICYEDIFFEFTVATLNTRGINNIKKSQLNQLIKIQKKAIRAIFNAKYNTTLRYFTLSLRYLGVALSGFG